MTNTNARQRIREPIGEAKPAGDDLSFDPAFETVAKEIARLESMDGGRPDWKLVEQESERLLVERTRDLRLVSWSIAAKVQLRKWEGLAEGLGLYLDVLPFWDAMFPPLKRLRARANLHDWMIQHVVPLLEELESTRADEHPLIDALATLQEIESTVSEKLGDLHQGSARLRSVIKRAIDVLPAPEPEPEPEPEPAPEPAPEAASEPSARPEREYSDFSSDDPVESIRMAVEDLPSPESSRPRRGVPSERPPSRPVLVYEPQGHQEAATTLEASLDALLVAARLFAEEDPSDSRAFQLRQVVGALRFDPTPHVFPAPDTSLRETFASLLSQGSFARLIDEAQEAITSHPAWLDAYRYLHDALAGSGAMWTAARQVVLQETMALLARSPMLLGRKFDDGTPVADPATQEWIERERKRAAGASAIVGAEDQENEKRFGQVRELAAEGRATDAITLAIALANRAADARGRFRGYVLAGTTALSAGNPAIARPLLEGLLELVQRHHLETWEPALCATLYGSLLACLRALGNAESSRDQDLFDRLCRLDPAAAMRLGGPR